MPRHARPELAQALAYWLLGCRQQRLFVCHVTVRISLRKVMPWLSSLESSVRQRGAKPAERVALAAMVRPLNAANSRRRMPMNRRCDSSRTLFA